MHPAPAKSVTERVVPWVLIVLAGLAAAGAVIRMLAAGDILKRLDSTTLMYLGVAGALLLLREVKSLSFGDYKVEFQRLEQMSAHAVDVAEKSRSEAAQAKTVARDAQAIANSPRDTSLERSSVEIEHAAIDGDRTHAAGLDAQDPWKGKFGGAARNRDRVLSASVEPVPGSTKMFRVRLAVHSTRPESNPLRGLVRFYLHPTFPNSTPVVQVGPNGVAELNLSGWGAFTVGAEADDGQTKLELDLMDVPAPRQFHDN